MLIIPFLVWAGIKIDLLPIQEMDLKLILAQTGNGTIKNTQIVKLIYQLIAELQKGRACNS